MPRRPRVLIEGAVYHVYNRFARGEDVFGDPEEAIEFIELLRSVKQRDQFVVFAWCVMSNHYHIAIRSSAVPLPRTMQFLQGRFSRDFNRRWGRTGPLWQSRYKAKVIDEPGYLPRVIQYIHLNPVRAGELAGVLRKHTVVVSRWVRQGRQLRDDDEEFSVTIETIDKAFSELATRQNKYSGRNKIKREKTKNR